MIWDSRLRTAIVAINQCFSVSKLSRHWLAFDSAIQVSKASLHVGYAFAAYRTTIRRFGVFCVALMMYTVSASHEDNCIGRCEHVFPADRTVTLSRALDASMGIFDGDRHTHAACLKLN